MIKPKRTKKKKERKNQFDNILTRFGVLKQRATQEKVTTLIG